MLNAFSSPYRGGGSLHAAVSAGGFYIAVKVKSLGNGFDFVWRLSSFPIGLMALYTELGVPKWPKYAYFNDPSNDLFYLAVAEAKQPYHYLITFHTRNEAGTEERAVSVLLRHKEFDRFFEVLTSYWMS